MARKKMRFYVAVVAEELNNVPLIRSRRTFGDYASFFGTDQESVTAAALRAARNWGEQYRVYVGELTGCATPLTEYRVTKI